MKLWQVFVLSRLKHCNCVLEILPSCTIRSSISGIYCGASPCTGPIAINARLSSVMSNTKHVPASAVLVNPLPSTSAFAIREEPNKSPVEISLCHNTTEVVIEGHSTNVDDRNTAVEHQEASVALNSQLESQMAKVEGSSSESHLQENSPSLCRKRKLTDTEIVTGISNVVNTPLFKKSHLSSDMFKKITSIVKNTGYPGGGDVKEASFMQKEPVPRSYSKNDYATMMVGENVKCKMHVPEAGSGSSDEIDGSSVPDISLLFSKTFDKSYKQYEKSVKMKKKRKRKNGNSIPDDDDGKGAQKQRPNYFLSIQVTNPNIHRGIEFVQQQIMNMYSGRLRGALIPLPTLHLTLCVFHLDSSTPQLEQAQLALQSCAEKLQAEYCKHPVQFTVSGVSHFRGAVIYADLVKDEAFEKIQAMAEVLVESLKACKVVTPEHKVEFTPHITLLKLSKVKKWKRGEKKIYKLPPTVYEPFLKQNFGKQTVRSVQMCAMLKKKPESGYYHVDHQLDFVPVNHPLDEAGEQPLDYLTSADIERYRALIEHSPTVFVAKLENKLEWNFLQPSQVNDNVDEVVSPSGD